MITVSDVGVGHLIGHSPSPSSILFRYWGPGIMRSFRVIQLPVLKLEFPHILSLVFTSGSHLRVHVIGRYVGPFHVSNIRDFIDPLNDPSPNKILNILIKFF